jgi:hypothetical protein
MPKDYQEEIISLIKTYARLYYCVAEENEAETRLKTAESKIRAELSQYGNARELQGVEKGYKAREEKLEQDVHFQLMSGVTTSCEFIMKKLLTQEIKSELN